MGSCSIKSLLSSISCCQNFWQKAFRGLYKFAIIFLNMSLTPRPLLNNFKNCNFGTSRLLLGKEMVSQHFSTLGGWTMRKIQLEEPSSWTFFILALIQPITTGFWIFPPSYRKRRKNIPESQKPRQRVSNADWKVFANPERFCDKFIIGWRISGYFAKQNIQIICKVSRWTGKFSDHLKSVQII